MKKFIGIGGCLLLLGCVAACPTAQDIQITEPLVVTEIPAEPPKEEHYFMVLYEPVVSQYKPREFTQEEAQMLMKIAQAEAGNQGIKGMMLVMAVILNRVADPAFPNSIKEVIFQPHQFQPVSDGRYDDVELSEDVHLALAEIEKGTPIDTEIIGFEVADSNALDCYFEYAYTVGGHKFYKRKEN